MQKKPKQTFKRSDGREFQTKKDISEPVKYFNDISQ